MAALKIDLKVLETEMKSQMKSDGKYNISELARKFETTRTTIRKYMGQVDKELSNSKGSENEKKSKNKTAKSSSKKSPKSKKTKASSSSSAKTAGTKVSFDVDKLETLMLDQLDKDGKYNISELARLMESSRGTVKKYMDKIDKPDGVTKTIPCPKPPQERFPLGGNVVKENHLPAKTTLIKGNTLKTVVGEVEGNQFKSPIDLEREAINKPVVEFMIGHNMAMINFLDGKGVQTVMASDCNFPKLTEALHSQDIDAIKAAMSKEVMIAEKSKGKTKMDKKTGKLIHNGMPVSDVMQDYVKRHFQDGDIPDGFFKFLDKVYVQNKYSFTVCPEKDFMEYVATGKLIINDEGNLLAYKIVSSSYRDKHSGTYLYKVGETYEMPRTSVTQNRNTHCAAGFHACTFAYFSGYASGGNRVLVCEIDPRDVVSIPNDQKSKLRCCRYKMIGDLGVFPNQKPLELWFKEYTASLAKKNK